jgi:hypothetical protein
MNKSAFIQIRHCLGKSQREMASLLAVSLKGVQSFEQGWRNIPVHVERQMLFLAAMKSSRNTADRPCWKARNCPEAMKRRCPAWELQARTLCWMINGLVCQGRVQQSWQKKMEICRECLIFQSIMPQCARTEDGGEGA